MIDKLSRAIEGDTLRWTHWVIAGACALLPASVCGLNESLLYVRLDLHEDLSIGDFERSQLSAAALVGICLGSFFCAALNAAIGRRSIILVGLAPAAVCMGLQAFARRYVEMLIIRGVAGFFLGLACAAAGVYLAEMLPIAYRGRFMLGVNIGYTAFAVCMVYFNSLADLRVFLAFTACPAALATALFLCLPESPRYLALKERTEEAVEAVVWLSDGSASREDLAALNENPQEDAVLEDPGAGAPGAIAVPFWSVLLSLGAPWFCLAVASGGLRFLFPVYIYPHENPALLLLACAGADFTGGLTATFSADTVDRRMMFVGAMFVAAAASFASVAVGPRRPAQMASAALQQGAQAIPWVNMLALSCEVFPTERRAGGAAALRGTELVGLVATQVAAGALIERGLMREAVIGYSAMYALGGVLGIALLRNVPPTVGKPIVESWRAPDSGHKPRAD